MNITSFPSTTLYHFGSEAVKQNLPAVHDGNLGATTGRKRVALPFLLSSIAGLRALATRGLGHAQSDLNPARSARLGRESSH
jgi:hypothetical protein